MNRRTLVMDFYIVFLKFKDFLYKKFFGFLSNGVHQFMYGAAIKCRLMLLGLFNDRNGQIRIIESYCINILPSSKMFSMQNP